MCTVERAVPRNAKANHKQRTWSAFIVAITVNYDANQRKKLRDRKESEIDHDLHAEQKSI